VDAQAIAAVGRDRHVNDGIIQAHDLRERRANFRVGRQLDDAVMLLRQAHLAFGAQHAARIDAANADLFQVDARAGNARAGGREDALHARARVGRAADDLHLALARLDAADAQAVGVGMLRRLDDIADGEGRQRLRAVLDALDLEPDDGQLLAQRVERCLGVEMVLQPTQGELHGLNPPTRLGVSSGTKP
jgi:hypothetical protein